MGLGLVGYFYLVKLNGNYLMRNAYITKEQRF